MRTLVTLLILTLAVPAWARCTLDDFLARGRYGVGHRQLALVDTARGTDAWAGRPALPSRSLPTEVWYPIAGTSAGTPVEEAPLAAGRRFPLIVNSPGLGDLGTGEAYLAIVLASRGYVVASPTFPLTNTGFLLDPAGPYLQDIRNQPGDVSFILDHLIALARTSGTWLARGVDERRIGLTGLSLGGMNTLLATYHPTLRDRRVKAAAALAPASCFLNERLYGFAKPPLLLVVGDEDLITPLATNARATFERARSPRRLVTLAKATHTAFSSLIGIPSATSYDTIGCSVLEGKITQQQVDDTIAGFGSGSAPYVSATGCALPCTTPAPATAPMQAMRQHDLTQAAVVAFFEATFRGVKDGACFLQRGLVREADVTVERAKGRRLPRR